MKSGRKGKSPQQPVAKRSPAKPTLISQTPPVGGPPPLHSRKHVNRGQPHARELTPSEATTESDEVLFDFDSIKDKEEQEWCMRYVAAQECASLRQLVTDYRKRFLKFDRERSLGKLLPRRTGTMMGDIMEIAEAGMKQFRTLRHKLGERWTEYQEASRRLHAAGCYLWLFVPEFPSRPWDEVKTRHNLARNFQELRASATCLCRWLETPESAEMALPLNQTEPNKLVLTFDVRLGAANKKKLAKQFCAESERVEKNLEIATMRPTGGRKGRGGMPLFNDVVRSYRAMRAIFRPRQSPGKVAQNDEMLEALGGDFQRGKSQNTSRNDYMVRQARTSANGFRRYFHRLLHVTENPVHWPDTME